MQDYGGVSVLVVAAAAAPHLCTFDHQLQEGTVSWEWVVWWHYHCHGGEVF
jgi:hypothetical protein